jgi:hypothetical protein
VFLEKEETKKGGGKLLFLQKNKKGRKTMKRVSGCLLFISIFFCMTLAGCFTEMRLAGPVGPPPDAQYADTDPAMAPEIVYGEPNFYDPPIVADVPYDYFVYERDGDFVNIVFIDSFGHRFPRHWNYGGHRMTYGGMHAWHQGYRTSRGSLARHNQKIGPAGRHNQGRPGVAGPSHQAPRQGATHSGPGVTQHQGQRGGPGVGQPQHQGQRGGPGVSTGRQNPAPRAAPKTQPQQKKR